jgi:hypothetical protein
VGPAAPSETITDAFPAFASLPEPPRIQASPRLDLSNATEPLVLTGLVGDNAFEGIPDDLLTTTGGKVRVDVWPVDGGPCPAKAGGIIIGPTLVPVAADRVLPLLRETQRGYHAYIRHLDLNSFPDVADRLPLKRARQLCGPRIKSANLWLGDGRVQSAVHWDGHDNLLLQLEAVWKSTSAGALTRPRWLRRAVRNRHRHAIEQASRRRRGGRRERAVTF